MTTSLAAPTSPRRTAMSRILAPGVALMNRLSYFWKFALISALFILVSGLAYLDWRRRAAAAAGGAGIALVLTPLAPPGVPILAAALAAVAASRMRP